ncbi:MAG: hypothetical protein Q9M92_03705 [Enterobacterales bacterium]|nr:hypothetical protein [Enterobacterales bacterium]
MLGFVYWLGQQSAENKSPNEPQSKLGIIVKDPQTQGSAAEQSIADLQPKQTTRLALKPQLTSNVSLTERMLGNERWDSNGHWSMIALLSLWQLDYSPLNDGQACDYAANYGLRCHQAKANWQQLREFNRPAILKFSAGLQGEFWGTLIKLKGSNAELKFGDRSITLGLDELSTLWTGDYQILWQAPQGYQGDILLGQKGEAVKWLSEKLKILLNPSLEISEHFEQNLLVSLSQYQKQRNIQSDGIAGIQTILTINGETLDGIPLLVDY